MGEDGAVHDAPGARLRLTDRGRVVLGVLAAVLLLLVTSVVRGDGGGDKVATGGPTPTVVRVIEGQATFYGPGLPADAVTADGTPFDPQAAAAAHPDLPFGTDVRVVRPDTGASVVVEVNDRLPEDDSSRIDLTVGAATVLGMREEGRVPVRLEVLGKGGR